MLNTSLLINLLGFSIGIALYGLLFVMVVRHRRDSGRPTFDILLLATACLGLVWNLGEFVVFVLKDFGSGPISPALLATSYSALGFLPSVVVHSTWKNVEPGSRRLRSLTFAAYGVSSVAAALNFYSAIVIGTVPSGLALRILTMGALALLCGLLVLAFRQALEKKAVWITALLIFAVSALHLGAHSDQSSWIVELVAHQSSLPLALAILLQDYRFAFADLFLKRALSLMILALGAFALYVGVAVPLLAWHETHDRNDVQAAVTVLGLWIATALAYPKIHAFAEWFVDSIVLQRTNFARLLERIAADIEQHDHVTGILDAVCGHLKNALAAETAEWRECEGANRVLQAVSAAGRRATVSIATVESPHFEIGLSDFSGGRNLLSGEIQMLGSVAMMTARRVDSLRVTHERCEVEIREQEFSKLATEAQLSALRAQINPHFLFNSLTTIGYLIRSAPDKAFDTLMRLTRLLRSVLSSTGEFSTVADEIHLIENYLDIEKARFEERLGVTIEIPAKLGTVRIPSLMIQPLVENAIKHGISQNRAGGEVRILAAEEAVGDRRLIRLTVKDTGSGRSAGLLERPDGVGLKNIRQRLQSYYGADAELSVVAESNGGTRAEIVLPLNEAAARVAA
ncbi:MAG: histidine kinase [Acidobacteria bacterium]|nr:histidine kinase [Acidobacteriota bacterium]